MKNLAIITARSGSKGLPNKNIRPLAGKPLMAWTIEAALKSGVYDKVMVTTDSEEYARIAREWGGEVPFFRSAENSGDRASSWDTVREVLDCYAEQGECFDTFTILQPTSPLRSAEDIRAAYRLFEEKNASSVVAVCEADQKPHNLKTLPEDGSLVGFVLREENRPRQAFADYYRLNGALYVVRVADFPADNFIYDSNCFAYVMPRERSYDIDEKLDFVIAEAIMKNFDMI